MTEDEAKTKWCPQAERFAPKGASEDEVKGALFCIGSKCMAWRAQREGRKWNVDADRWWEHGDGFLVVIESRKSYYCGLAGEP